jgi:hypothetical protein
MDPPIPAIHELVNSSPSCLLAEVAVGTRGLELGDIDQEFHRTTSENMNLMPRAASVYGFGVATWRLAEKMSLSRTGHSSTTVNAGNHVPVWRLELGL